MVENKRVEESYGKLISCGYFYKSHEIDVGSKWQSSGGFVVEVTDVKKFIWTFRGKEQVDYQVHYKWIEDGIEKVHDKDIFNFQIRYCLILGEVKL